MKFSINVEFNDITERDLSSVIPESEAARLANDIYMLLRAGEMQTNYHGVTAQGSFADTVNRDFAALFTRMAAANKLTELRILHSILVTYPTYIAKTTVWSDRVIARCVTAFLIEIELNEQPMTIEAEVDGRPVIQRVRKIDLETSPNRDGNVIRRDEANMPKRRMRIRSNN